MKRKIGNYLAARSGLQIAMISLLSLVVISGADYLSGYEVSFSIFYVIPIALSAWYLGRRPGILICLVAATTWFFVDYASGHSYSHFAIMFWNAGVRLAFFLIIANLLIHLRASFELQTSLAQRDGLTGILNGRAFKERYAMLAGLAARHRRSIALGYLDVDGFKGINDQLGHGVGDQVLKAVASALTERLRGSDCVGRLGGDEFAILLPDVTLDGAKKLFGEILETLNALARRND